MSFPEPFRGAFITEKLVRLLVLVAQTWSSLDGQRLNNIIVHFVGVDNLDRDHHFLLSWTFFVILLHPASIVSMRSLELDRAQSARQDGSGRVNAKVNAVSHTVHTPSSLYAFCWLEFSYSIMALLFNVPNSHSLPFHPFTFILKTHSLSSLLLLYDPRHRWKACQVLFGGLEKQSRTTRPTACPRLWLVLYNVYMNNDPGSFKRAPDLNQIFEKS